MPSVPIVLLWPNLKHPIKAFKTENKWRIKLNLWLKILIKKKNKAKILLLPNNGICLILCKTKTKHNYRIHSRIIKVIKNYLTLTLRKSKIKINLKKIKLKTVVWVVGDGLALIWLFLKSLINKSQILTVATRKTSKTATKHQIRTSTTSKAKQLNRFRTNKNQSILIKIRHKIKSIKNKTNLKSKNKTKDNTKIKRNKD